MQSVFIIGDYVIFNDNITNGEVDINFFVKESQIISQVPLILPNTEG